MIEKERCLMQNVEIVEMIVKYHSNQKKTDQYIAMNVSKSINQHQEVVVADLAIDLEVMAETEAADLAVMAETEVLDLAEETTDHERCLMQNVEIVEMIVKYHSNQKKTDQYIAMTASKITDKISKLF